MIRHTVRLIALLTLLATTTPLLAWGAGHKDLQQAIVEALSASLRDQFSPEAVERSIATHAKYPDSFDSFEPERGLIGDKGMARLAEYGIERRYDLHHDRGRAVMFIQIVEALRQERYDTALFWIACLGHAVGDMAAINHDPLVHVATYDWPTLDARLPGGTSLKPALAQLDLHATGSRPTGQRAIADAVQAMRLSDDGRSGEQALLAIMMYGHRGAAFCAPRGVPILQAAYDYAAGDKSALHRVDAKMAELGAWAAVRVARDVEVAQRLARSLDRPLQLTPELLQQHERNIREHLAHVDLGHDALFKDLLNVRASRQPGTIGIVAEPAWRMNEGMLAFADRVIAAAACRTLRELGRSAELLDVRQLTFGNTPDPAQVPIIILPAGRIHSYHAFKGESLNAALADYLHAGGRVLWVGGRRSGLPALRPVSRHIVEADDADWPVPIGQFVGARVRIPDTGAEWTILRTPATKAGWQRPTCGLTFGKGNSTTPLLTLHLDDRKQTIGIITNDPSNVAFLPRYAIWPYLMTKADPFPSPEALTLDAAGTAILQAALERLLP